ncbi:hypothetical protein SNK04_013840 [Fusarium graminearum]
MHERLRGLGRSADGTVGRAQDDAHLLEGHHRLVAPAHLHQGSDPHGGVFLAAPPVGEPHIADVIETSTAVLGPVGICLGVVRVRCAGIVAGQVLAQALRLVAQVEALEPVPLEQDAGLCSGLATEDVVVQVLRDGQRLQPLRLHRLVPPRVIQPVDLDDDRVRIVPEDPALVGVVVLLVRVEGDPDLGAGRSDDGRNKLVPAVGRDVGRLLHPHDRRPFERLDAVGGVVLQAREAEGGASQDAGDLVLALLVDLEVGAQAHPVDVVLNDPLGGLSNRLLDLAHAQDAVLGLHRQHHQDLRHGMRLGRAAPAVQHLELLGLQHRQQLGRDVHRGMRRLGDGVNPAASRRLFLPTRHHAHHVERRRRRQLIAVSIGQLHLLAVALGVLLAGLPLDGVHHHAGSGRIQQAVLDLLHDLVQPLEASIGTTRARAHVLLAEGSGIILVPTSVGGQPAEDRPGVGHALCLADLGDAVPLAIRTHTRSARSCVYLLGRPMDFPGFLASLVLGCLPAIVQLRRPEPR